MIRSTITNTVLFTTVLCASLSAHFFYSSSRFGFSFFGPFQTDASNKDNTPWRYTTEGWQSADNWGSDTSFIPIRTFELVHPVVFATCILLAVIATMIWASSEWDVARLISANDPFDETDAAKQ